MKYWSVSQSLDDTMLLASKMNELEKEGSTIFQILESSSQEGYDFRVISYRYVKAEHDPDNPF